MIGNNSITQIAHIFCGDAEDYYSYKSGSELVRFLINIFTLEMSINRGFRPDGRMYMIRLLGC